MAQARAESRLEMGEIPALATDKLATSLGKSPIVGAGRGLFPSSREFAKLLN